MAWSSTILSILDNPVPNGTKYMKVQFVNGPKEFQREFKLSPGMFTTHQEILNFLAAECTKLNDAEAIAVDLSAFVSQEITTSGPKNVAKMWQARAVLRNHGHFDTVNTLITNSGNTAWIEAWEYAPEISRDSDMVMNLGTALGLTETEIDTLFEEARNLVV